MKQTNNITPGRRVELLRIADQLIAAGAGRLIAAAAWHPDFNDAELRVIRDRVRKQTTAHSY